MSIKPKVGRLFTAPEVEDLLDEIERLLRALERTRPHIRNEIIEECALVAENAKSGWTPKFIAVAIRALKDKL